MCVLYIGDGSIIYVYDCLIFSPSKDKIDDFYASLQEYFNI